MTVCLCLTWYGAGRTGRPVQLVSHTCCCDAVQQAVRLAVVKYAAGMLKACAAAKSRTEVGFRLLNA